MRINVQHTMGKILSTLRKNKYITNISLHQIYLPNFYENILKYYRLNPFKVTIIYFKHNVQMTSECESLSDGFLVKVDKYCLFKFNYLKPKFDLKISSLI